MTEFKVGDKITIINRRKEGSASGIAGDRRLIYDKIYKGEVIKYYPSPYRPTAEVNIFGEKMNNKTGYTTIFTEAIVGAVHKIKVGSTYFTPTGLKRKVIFADDVGVLCDTGAFDRKWVCHKSTENWMYVPPEEWVNLSWRGDINRTIDVSSKKFSTDVEAMNDVISGVKANRYIRTVRVDEKYNTSSV